MVAALWGAIGLPLEAFAHALLQTSEPAASAEVSTAPKVVTITFGEEPDVRLSTITVLDSSSQSVTAGRTTAVPGQPRELQVALRPLSRGVYTVAWRTVSSVDGHYATGAYAFGVGVSPGSEVVGQNAQIGTPPPSALAVAGRWLLFAGLIALLGAAVVGAVTFAVPPRAVIGLLPIAWVVAAIGTALVAEAQRADAGVSLSGLFSSSLGTSLTRRMVTIVIAAAAVAAVMVTRGAMRRSMLLLTAAAAAGAMLADVTASHAAAQSPVFFNDVAQWLHILAVGVWIGGLAALLVGVRGSPSDEKARAVRRFSAVAGVALVVVALSGIARAIIEVGAWDRLTATAFGKLIILKLALITILAVLGAINRYRNVPSAPRALRGLRRIGGTELMAAGAAILVASSLVNVAPPISAAASPSPPGQAAPLVVSGSDYGTTVRVRLEVSPGMAGFNTFVARVTDYDSGQPVQADGVSLSFSIPARPDLGSSTLSLSRSASGTYTARGANMSLDGEWRVTVLVARGAASAEVALRITPRPVPPKVDKVRLANGLTLYTIHLSGGRTVQDYLDPNRAGADEFHATFFDAKGNELPVTSASIAVTAPRGGAHALPIRRLEPGHFVADVTVGQGTYRFDIAGSTDSGEHISTHLDLTPGS